MRTTLLSLLLVLPACDGDRSPPTEVNGPIKIVQDVKAGDTKAGGAKAGDAKAGDAKAGDAKAPDAKTAAPDAKAGGQPYKPPGSTLAADAPAPTVDLTPPTLPKPEGAVKASRIKPGDYECKISKEYRMRPCTVALDEHGRSILSIPQALVAIKGVLTDKGSTTQFSGVYTDPRPFNCFSCAERCVTDPKSCTCQELPPEGSAECLNQPLEFTLTPGEKGWRGTLKYRAYYSDRRNANNKKGYTFEDDKAVVVMRKK